MALLLDRRGDQIVITEDIMKDAAGSGNNPVIALLFNRRRDQIVITEDIVKAAASSIFGDGVMALLLDQYGNRITITEDILIAVAENEISGEKIMTVLLNRCGD
ncbi:hypothetical protein M431DRAFT_17704 [Trichoderma harzianum CBS 226.95]|uniref:Uncharacterized protein n=1 Tax=Trichoderma harzianum CBS 226.95 TaxID=983964 RepID=A0A2T4ABG8_TRIHA|nr:hypothetical protein M431DRAFT_17704 [Trichoderma harzianum CBS 226.95]PTB54392.1 hypothetical protein M431DRAFT_17704 [Trichoderma harzianum CBS 226.95]